MGKGRKTRCKVHNHEQRNVGETCFICHAPLDRKSRKVAFGKDKTVKVCRPCMTRNNLESAGK
jgi:hypothetical protein